MPDSITPSFALLIKPLSADCNLRCDYCFYLPKAALYPHSKTHRISDEVLERIIASYLQTSQPQYSFGWQGGEPTLLGLEFLEKIVHLQKKHGKPGSIIANGVQTNATLIDDRMAEFLARYRFLVGVSIDGPEALHDAFRKTAGGTGTYRGALSGIARLKRHHVAMNTLTVVNARNVSVPDMIFRHLCELGFDFQQYIPCVEFDTNGHPRPWTITGDQWGRFLCALFDEWFDNTNRGVSISHFDAVLEYRVTGRKTNCAMKLVCDGYLLVEHNGDVYPCDFFAEPDHRLGNIMDSDWVALRRSPIYIDFTMRKGEVNPECAACRYVELCAGDCPKHRYRHDRNARALSWLCQGWKMFYDHALTKLAPLAKSIKSRNRSLVPAHAGKIAPNAPCPCGSGLKYKRCCGRASHRRPA